MLRISQIKLYYLLWFFLLKAIKYLTTLIFFNYDFKIVRIVFYDFKVLKYIFFNFFIESVNEFRLQIFFCVYFLKKL